MADPTTNQTTAIYRVRIFVSTCLIWLASRVMPVSCRINIEGKP